MKPNYFINESRSLINQARNLIKALLSLIDLAQLSH